MTNVSDCDGCETGCSWCCGEEEPSYVCENCGNWEGEPVVDETDPGIVYCSPECRAEFVAAAEREVA